MNKSRLFRLLLFLNDPGVCLIGQLGQFREQEGVSYLCPVNQKENHTVTKFEGVEYCGRQITRQLVPGERLEYKEN